MDAALDAAARSPGLLVAWFGFTVASVYWTAWLDLQGAHIYAAGLAGGSLLGCFAQYAVLRTLLRDAGYDPDNSNFPAFLGLEILLLLGIVFGLMALLVPALIMMARWSLARQILLVEGTSVSSAIGQSWDRTSGNTIPLLLCFLPVFLLAVPELLLRFLGTTAGAGSIMMSALLSGLSAVYVICLSVVFYGALSQAGAPVEITGETGG